MRLLAWIDSFLPSVRPPEPLPVPAACPEPPAPHTPPEPVLRAERCGVCSHLIPDSYPSLEFCGAKCAAEFVSGLPSRPWGSWAPRPIPDEQEAAA